MLSIFTSPHYVMTHLGRNTAAPSSICNKVIFIDPYENRPRRPSVYRSTSQEIWRDGVVRRRTGRRTPTGGRTGRAVRQRRIHGLRRDPLDLRTRKLASPQRD